jgi:hydrogenase maturation protease
VNLTRDPTPGDIVVLGVGNTQWADAGFGVRAIERFKAHWQCAPHVEIVEAGTRGLALLPLVEAARRLIVFNAVDLGHAPGTLHVRTGDDATDRLRTRGASLHQMDCVDALACAQLKGRAPREIVLIGVQPVELDTYGADLSPAVRAQLDPAIALACRWLRRWRAAPQPQTDPACGVRLTGVPPEGRSSLDIERE